MHDASLCPIQNSFVYDTIGTSYQKFNKITWYEQQCNLGTWYHTFAPLSLQKTYIYFLNHQCRDKTPYTTTMLYIIYLISLKKACSKGSNLFFCMKFLYRNMHNCLIAPCVSNFPKFWSLMWMVLKEFQPSYFFSPPYIWPLSEISIKSPSNCNS